MEIEIFYYTSAAIKDREFIPKSCDMYSSFNQFYGMRTVARR